MVSRKGPSQWVAAAWTDSTRVVRRRKQKQIKKQQKTKTKKNYALTVAMMASEPLMHRCLVYVYHEETPEF